MRWPIPWVWWEGRLSDQGRFDRWLASASLLGVDARCHGICLETSIAVTWAVTVSSFVRLVSSWRPSIFLLLYCSLARSWWRSHRSHLQKESVCSVDPRGWLWGCPLGLSYNCQHRLPIRCILSRLTAPSISGNAYSLFSGNELNQWLNAVETLKKPAEVRAAWYHIRIKIGVAEPFVIARDVDCQRHHFKLPIEQPITDSMGQCCGSFSASILVIADVFICPETRKTLRISIYLKLKGCLERFTWKQSPSMRTETKAFGSPSMRSSILECLPRDDIFSAEVKNRIFCPDIISDVCLRRDIVI